MQDVVGRPCCARPSLPALKMKALQRIVHIAGGDYLVPITQSLMLCLSVLVDERKTHRANRVSTMLSTLEANVPKE